MFETVETSIFYSYDLFISQKRRSARDKIFEHKKHILTRRQGIAIKQQELQFHAIVYLLIP